MLDRRWQLATSIGSLSTSLPTQVWAPKEGPAEPQQPQDSTVIRLDWDDTKQQATQTLGQKSSNTIAHHRDYRFRYPRGRKTYQSRDRLWVRCTERGITSFDSYCPLRSTHMHPWGQTKCHRNEEILVLHHPSAREARPEPPSVPDVTPAADSGPWEASGEKMPHFYTKTTSSVSLHEGHPVEAQFHPLPVTEILLPGNEKCGI